MQRLWSTSKRNIFLQLHIDILSGRTSHEGVWGCLLNLPPHNCRLFLNRVFQRWRLKTTGKVSLVQFSCTKKLLMKLEVNQWSTSATMPFKKLCCLISKSLSCMIDLKIKQIWKKSIYHERHAISSDCLKDLSQGKKKLEVVAFTIVSQFGVNFKIMFLVVR